MMIKMLHQLTLPSRMITMSVAKSDSCNTAFKKVKAVPFLAFPSPEAPLALKQFVHSTGRALGSGDSALHIIDDKEKPILIIVFGELARGQNWDLNKVGLYLDIVLQSMSKEVSAYFLYIV